MTINLIFILIGFVLLYFGAEWLVKGAASLAVKLGISQLVVGLTVVAFGTSAPELVVSLDAGLKGHGDIAIGNVIGSNMFNIAVILGISAMICPIKIHRQILRFDAPLMMIVTILFSLMIIDHKVGRIEGLILFSGIVAYTAYSVFGAKKHPADNPEIEKEVADETSEISEISICMFFVVAGLATLIVGSKFLVEGAVNVAKIFNVSEAVIGLTIVAAGTSLPELATSVVAAVKKKSDIAIGNIVGSNIFNIMCIIGLTGLITPITFPGISMTDLAFMLLTTFILFPFMLSGKILNRLEGLVLFIIYVIYVYLLLPTK